MTNHRKPSREARVASVFGAAFLALGVLAFAPEKASAQQSQSTAQSDSAAAQSDSAPQPKRRTRRAQRCMTVNMSGLPMQICPDSSGQMMGTIPLGGGGGSEAPPADSTPSDTTKPKD